MRVTVSNHQTLWDLCLQHTGTIAGTFDLAMANDLSPTDVLSPGQQLEIPDGLERDAAVLAYYRKNRIEPATAPGQQPRVPAVINAAAR